jgi:hypothetical protein
MDLHLGEFLNWKSIRRIRRTLETKSFPKRHQSEWSRFWCAGMYTAGENWNFIEYFQEAGTFEASGVWCRAIWVIFFWTYVITFVRFILYDGETFVKANISNQQEFLVLLVVVCHDDDECESYFHTLVNSALVLRMNMIPRRNIPSWFRLRLSRTVYSRTANGDSGIGLWQ